MSHYKPYPAYKDSGVEWIGPVPEHWETVRIKRGASLRNERRNDSPDRWTYVGLEDVESESGRYAPTAGVSRQSEDSMVGVFHAGDVLYGKLRPYLRKAIVAEQDGLCSTEFLVLLPGRSAAPWVHRWLLTQEVTQQIEAGSDGAKMPRADWEHVGSIPMPLPPSAEQTTIAAALDRETARIDALIAKKTRFIELLKEKRQALITHAVTKGLDPNVKMKDSGMEWIGDVPEHWAVSRLGHFATVENGTTPSRANEAYWVDGDVAWLGSGEVNQVVVTEATEHITERALRECSLRLLPKGTVVVGMVGQGKTRGLAAILDIDATINQNLAAVCPGPKLGGLFLLHVFAAAYEWLRKGGRGSNQAALNCELLGEFRLAVPPDGEQQQIVSHITDMTKRLDSIASKTEQSMRLLKERRSALITAAVTGQIDLREAA